MTFIFCTPFTQISQSTLDYEHVSTETEFNMFTMHVS